MATSRDISKSLNPNAAPFPSHVPCRPALPPPPPPPTQQALGCPYSIHRYQYYTSQTTPLWYLDYRSICSSSDVSSYPFLPYGSGYADHGLVFRGESDLMGNCRNDCYFEPHRTQLYPEILPEKKHGGLTTVYRRSQKKLMWVETKKERKESGGVISALPRSPPSSTCDFVASGVTTVMIKNIPNQFKRRDILHILDEHCKDENRRARLRSDLWKSEYDFVYVPMDFRKFWYEGRASNLGYAFVNFTNSTASSRFFNAYQSYNWEVDVNRKVCEVCTAKIQGKSALKAAFSNKIFWCHTGQFLPLILSPPSNGVRGYSSIAVGRRIATLPPKPIKKAFSSETVKQECCNETRHS